MSLIHFLKKLFVLIFPKTFFVWNRNRIFTKYKNMSEGFLITGLWNKTVKHPLPKEFYDELVLHKFEDSVFFIPKHYHEILTAFFGDYMQLPPESERTKNKILECDFGKYGDVL